MTSFLHFQTSPTGARVPGGACGTDGDAGRLKLVAPRGSESAPVPIHFQSSARWTGGTVAKVVPSMAEQGRGTLTALGNAPRRLSKGRSHGDDASRPGGRNGRPTRHFPGYRLTSYSSVRGPGGSGTLQPDFRVFTRTHALPVHQETGTDDPGGSGAVPVFCFSRWPALPLFAIGQGRERRSAGRFGDSPLVHGHSSQDQMAA